MYKSAAQSVVQELHGYHLSIERARVAHDPISVHRAFTY